MLKKQRLDGKVEQESDGKLGREKNVGWEKKDKL